MTDEERTIASIFTQHGFLVLPVHSGFHVFPPSKFTMEKFNDLYRAIPGDWALKEIVLDKVKEKVIED